MSEFSKSTTMKSIIYRIAIAIPATLMVTYLITGSISKSGKFLVLDLLWTTATYYWFEKWWMGHIGETDRMGNKIGWHNPMMRWISVLVFVLITGGVMIGKYLYDKKNKNDETDSF